VVLLILIKMLDKFISSKSVSFLLTVILLHSHIPIAQSQEERESSPKLSLENLNSPSQTDEFLKKQNFFSLPISQSNTDSSETTRGQNIRRQPIEGEEEFKPERLPIILPGLEEIEKEETAPTFYKASPNISIITPSGYGADWGEVGVGIGFQERTRFTNDSDAVFGIGFGLGDAQKFVGVQVGVTLTDISDPFDDARVSVKIHRRLPYDFSVAVGVQGGVVLGQTDGGSSVYGVVTKRFPLKQDIREPFSEIYASIGIGGGQFRSESDINEGIESVGVFGSVAVRVLEPMSLITEWTGQDLTIGISIVPFRNLPLVIVPAITDITGSAGDGTRFIFGVGYSFSF
jgi:hypothetical protein